MFNAWRSFAEKIDWIHGDKLGWHALKQSHLFSQEVNAENALKNSVLIAFIEPIVICKLSQWESWELSWEFYIEAPSGSLLIVLLSLVMGSTLCYQVVELGEQLCMGATLVCIELDLLISTSLQHDFILKWIEMLTLLLWWWVLNH